MIPDFRQIIKNLVGKVIPNTMYHFEYINPFPKNPGKICLYNLSYPDQYLKIINITFKAKNYVLQLKARLVITFSSAMNRNSILTVTIWKLPVYIMDIIVAGVSTIRPRITYINKQLPFLHDNKTGIIQNKNCRGELLGLNRPVYFTNISRSCAVTYLPVKNKKNLIFINKFICE